MTAARTPVTRNLIVPAKPNGAHPHVPQFLLGLSFLLPPCLCLLSVPSCIAALNCPDISRHLCLGVRLRRRIS